MQCVWISAASDFQLASKQLALNCDWTVGIHESV